MLRCVVFDLGGVLVQIASDWPDALSRAQIEASSGLGSFTSHGLFEGYQAGRMSDEEYLSLLGQELNTDPGLARRAHEAVIIREFPGAAELVQLVEDAGLSTGCLSNTNSLHWYRMTDPAQYPTVARLRHKAASQILGLSKPDPAIYKAFESMSGCSARELVFFDDSQANVDAAVALGWSAHRIDPLADPPGQMARLLEQLGAL